MKRLALGRRAHSPYEVRRPALELALEPVLVAVQPREPAQSTTRRPCRAGRVSFGE